MKIFTHSEVSLEAVCSVFIVKEFIYGAKNAIVEFRPANWDGKEMTEHDIAVDIPTVGICSKKSGNGDIVHPSLLSIVYGQFPDDEEFSHSLWDRTADAWMLFGSALSFLDSEKQISKKYQALSKKSLEVILEAFQEMHPDNDALVMERMLEILFGTLQRERSRDRALCRFFENMPPMLVSLSEFQS